MTNPYLTLEGVSHVLPTGRVLFSKLNENFDRRATGLVGRNGVGKSVLARILAGELTPTIGRCSRSGSVHYLAQQSGPPTAGTVAALAGVQDALDALTRIEAGSSDGADFDLLAERWDLPQRLQAGLRDAGLAHLRADSPAHTLSGGEAMRVALLGAALSGAGWLILDEPSNHLDARGREDLIDQLRRWQGGLLVVSHDRELLGHMARIVELSPLGLRSHGGNYAHYAQAKARENATAEEELARRKLERQRERKILQVQRERQERRLARGQRQGREANQARILLDRQKERSQGSGGKLRQAQDARRTELDAQVRDAAGHIAPEAAIHLHAMPTPPPFSSSHGVVLFEGVRLPFGAPALRGPIDLSLHSGQRLGIAGPNGCGKSTLLKVLAGVLPPETGRVLRQAPAVYLDQHLGGLAPQQSALARLRQAAPRSDEARLRMLLAQLGLDAGKAEAPSGRLSGGERLKAALACALYADAPAQLLVLDEPSNHLDLPSLQALESMLRNYRGCLVVASHDAVFMRQIALGERLRASDTGWLLEPWPPA
ncbi:ABC transporter ATP-binding protein [Corticibacter populi]|uniref:ABC transporter ATP-binding protein n=1 Tax=Corticibacter populi TaxID=1550736 RepID=A0A3M6QK57_9BURK|nr:ABC-F family ATP-binding cassette domain-containing protein [Corticibacter populi]RMX03486.1 ABC transporter ATP-binding protein [Corticibacter populi]RZS29926.1 ATPase subunit of ABC transporter with duplicated ATPase domains [Corticibacter populi]